MKQVPLTSGMWTLVDDADYPLVMKTRWYPSKDKRGKVYAKSKAHGYLHRFLMQPGPGLVVDHIDGSGLNNQRANLRVCSQAENSRNTESRGGTSKHKGVSWVASRERWVARLTVDGKVHQRYFKTELEAMEAYNDMAREHHGEFARLNHITEGPDELPEDPDARPQGA